MTEIANELDYQKKVSSYPLYRFNKIIQQSGGQDLTISGGGGQVSIFELPTQCYNLAKSELYFTLTPPAPGQAAGPQDLFNWAWKDNASPISRIQLYTRGGLYLCDLPYVANYTKVINKPETAYDEYVNYDQGFQQVGGQDNGTIRFLRKNNALVDNVAFNPDFAQRHDNTPANQNYTEPQYLESGVQGNANRLPVLNICLPLSHLKNTILACDKDLFFGEIMILRVEWAAVNRIGFRSEDPQDPTANTVQAVGDYDVSNLALYLAVEKNQQIANSLMAKTQSGFSMLVPYVHGYKTNLNAGTASVSLRFNRGHGKNLLKIYHSAFNNVETQNTAYEDSNIGGAKITSYYTMLNNSRLQEFNVQIGNDVYDDYLIVKDDIQGSVIQDSAVYRYNWFHVDNWSGIDLKDSQGAFNKDAGIGLNLEQKWDIYAETAAQLNHYSFAVCQKVLTITSAGVDFV